MNDFKKYGGNPGNPFEQFRNLTSMNENLRKLVGPQFIENMMKNMPLSEIDAVQKMDWRKWFSEGMFGGNPNPPTGSPAAPASAPSATPAPAPAPKAEFPRIDIYQTRQEVVAIVEVPGLESAKDVKINIRPNSLTVSGSLEGRFSTFKDERFFLNERFRNSFSRTVSLPVRVRSNQTRASCKNGLLEIRMVKDTRRTSPERGRSVPVTFD